MKTIREQDASRAPVTTLPELVFTRSGACFDPRQDHWRWADGPFVADLRFFRGIPSDFKRFVPALKQALLPFVKGCSSSHVRNLFTAFKHFAVITNTCPKGEITTQLVANYSAKLGDDEIGRLGTLSCLLQRWVALGLPGVDSKCADYLQGRRKPGNKKGEAVRTRDPVGGPFSDEEYRALYSAVNAAYGRGDYPLWGLLLTRLLLACGGRISQYASLKLCDFNVSTRVLLLPAGKTGEALGRSHFIDFTLSSQTASLLDDFLHTLRETGCGDDSPLFPSEMVMRRAPRSSVVRGATDPFRGHCVPSTLSHSYVRLTAPLAPQTSRLGFAPMPLAPKRFRYTLGTRLAEEGASKVLIANRLGHADLQNVECYVSASPKVVENYDKHMGSTLAPLAQCFQGRLVEGEEQSSPQGAPGSRIVDFRVSKAPVGSCADEGSGCAFNKPVACYTCIRFEPWLDAPHDKVLQRLLAEREKWSSDERMAAINDEPIRAVREVIALCTQAREQRGKATTGSPE